jgi:hypothetical protein
VWAEKIRKTVGGGIIRSEIQRVEKRNLNIKGDYEKVFMTIDYFEAGLKRQGKRFTAEKVAVDKIKGKGL